MKVFISWSGEDSQLLAEALHDWLPLVINAIVPFVSSQDISLGERGIPEISKELEANKFGIICVTRENMLKPWLNFEAGALSKSIGQSRVAPYLLDIQDTDLKPPLSQFQCGKVNEEGTKKLLKSLNDTVRLEKEPCHDDNALQTVFNNLWPILDKKIIDIPSVRATKPPLRSERELLEEILTVVREMKSNIIKTNIENVEDLLHAIDCNFCYLERNNVVFDKQMVDKLKNVLFLPHSAWPENLRRSWKENPSIEPPVNQIKEKE